MLAKSSSPFELSPVGAIGVCQVCCNADRDLYEEELEASGEANLTDPLPSTSVVELDLSDDRGSAAPLSTGAGVLCCLLMPPLEWVLRISASFGEQERLPPRFEASSSWSAARVSFSMASMAPTATVLSSSSATCLELPFTLSSKWSILMPRSKEFLFRSPVNRVSSISIRASVEPTRTATSPRISPRSSIVSVRTRFAISARS
mmetsp:Transcript_123379/g.245637  ORF Transcript_123379/g.245637 Transcript_123379/m.245637 type:complete len:204 (-) Transcript_123379:1105-1716(-)